MTLTYSEEKRLKEVETKAASIAHLSQGTGSKNELNRLLTLAQEGLKRNEATMEVLEAQVKELLDLARKLQ